MHKDRVGEHKPFGREAQKSRVLYQQIAVDPGIDLRTKFPRCLAKALAENIATDAWSCQAEEQNSAAAGRVEGLAIDNGLQVIDPGHVLGWAFSLFQRCPVTPSVAGSYGAAQMR
jgi:hypothetical protein